MNMQKPLSISPSLNKWIARLCARSQSRDFRNSVLALFDQALVSGTNFATTVMIGRMCGAEELGIYTLGFTLLILFNVVQEALIATPYTVYGNRLRPAERSLYAGSSLVHNLMLGAAVVTMLLVAYSVSSYFWPVVENEALLLIISAIVSFELMRQFARRFAFAALQLTSAVMIDTIVAGIHLFGLFYLVHNNILTAFSALTFTGAATAVASLIWFSKNYRAFRISLPAVWRDLVKNLHLGRWVFAGRLVAAVNNNMMHWLLAFFLGTIATGIFSGCMTVVLFSNPLFIGIGNILTARVSTAYAQYGPLEVRNVVLKSMLALGTLMGLFCLVLFFYAEAILQLLYNGEEFLGRGNVVAVLGLHMFVAGLNMPYYHGLLAIERPDINLKMNLIGLIVTLASAVVLLPYFGVMGAALSLLTGNVISSFIQAVIFLQIISGLLKEQNAVVEVHV